MQTGVLRPWARAAFAIFIALTIAAYVDEFPARFADFRAFYCAGVAVRAGADPYREHPLHECEHRLSAPALSPLDRAITIPAPFPGVILAVFAVMSLLPFGWALAACTAVSSAALLLAIGLIARLTTTPVAATAIVVVFPACIVPLPLGQPTPLVLLAIAACAALLHAGRPRLAALALLGTAFDPHVALAAGLGLFAAVRRARLVLVAGVLALGAASLVAGGAQCEWEYVRAVLPAHALANVPEFSQFSTANLAWMAGLPAGPALTLGHFWYLASLVVGTTVALRLRAALGEAAVAFVPPAFAVFGGAHTHLQQLALAVPAFLLVTSADGGATRLVLVIATFVAAAPWLIFVPFPVVFVSVGLLGAFFARAMAVPRIAVGFGLTLFWVATALCSAIAVSSATAHAASSPVVTAGNPLAEAAWGRFVSSTSVPPAMWVYLAKLPTIGAFALMLAILVRRSAAPVVRGARA